MKINKYLFVLMIALAFGISRLSAQNILTSTIEWKCNSTIDVTSGTFAEESTKIVTSPDQIIWYDTKNAIKETIAIESAEGSWTNVSNNGMVLFKVSSGNSSGVAQFMKEGGTIRIRIHLVNANDNFIYDLIVYDTNAL